MLNIHLLLTLGLISSVRAELTCLEWGLISPLVGIFCHFEPASFHTAEQKSTKAVEDAVESAKDLVEFDLTHNPVAVSYNFVEQTREGGIGQGEAYLRNVTTDFGKVTVGFGKETANQVVQVYNLAHWNDISMCIIGAATRQAMRPSRRMTKRAKALSASNGVAIAKKCAMNKLRSLSGPAVFNVTDSGQKIGSTISDLAGLLIPVGSEGEEVSLMSKQAVDLAVPGSEDAARVYKLVDGKSEHFTDAVEARATALKMKDQAWVADHCKICKAPPPAAIVGAKIRSKRWDLSAVCCPPVLAAHLIDATTVALSADEMMTRLQAFDEQFGPPELSDEEEHETTNLFEQHMQGRVSEAQLNAPRNYQARRIDTVYDIAPIRADLSRYSSSLMDWSTELRNTELSGDIFALLRHVFESADADDPLVRALDIYDDLELTSSSQIQFRQSCSSSSWIDSKDPLLQPIIKFAKAALDQCMDTVIKLCDMDVGARRDMHGMVTFAYDPPLTSFATSFDTQLMTVDPSTMRFITSDKTGLVVQREVDGTYAPLAPRDKSFYVLKGRGFTSDPDVEDSVVHATRYTEFGREAAQVGCVYISVAIY